MDEKTLKEKIKIAHESVKDEKDPSYKLEAFKIILSSLIGTENSKGANGEPIKGDYQQDDQKAFCFQTPSQAFRQE